MSGIDLTEKDGAVRIPVHVQPRASAEGFAGEHGGALKVRVTAPPADGKANEAVARLIADALGLPKGVVRVVSGHSSRRKLVEVEGSGAADVRRKLGL